MWANGPTRMWSETKRAGCTLLMEFGGFCGSYVCQRCKDITVGVYAIKAHALDAKKWVCLTCRDAAPEKELKRVRPEAQQLSFIHEEDSAGKYHSLRRALNGSIPHHARSSLSRVSKLVAMTQP